MACKATIVSLTILLALTFILPMVSSGMMGDFRGGDTSVTGQILYILRNPLHFIATFARFTVYDLPGLIMSQPTSVGIWLPYRYTQYILPVINLAYIIVLCYVVFTSRKPSSVYTWKVRIAILAIYLLVVYSAIGALYLSFTPVGASTIEGFQDRYLLPVFPLILVFLIPASNLSIKSKESQEKTNFAILYVPFLCLSLFLTCFILRVSII